jgi:predicted nucleotide-binding protein (sugar kinase/HSP70/actin superfamily)
MEKNHTKAGSLLGKTLYIPRMSVEGAALMAAAYRYMGVDGTMLPSGDDRTLELGRKYTIGEECYPEIVTLGGFLQIIESPDFDPEKAAFLMPTSGGPCRFGQYKYLLEKILSDKGLSDVLVLAPSSANGYEGIGGNAGDLVRLGWWAIVCADALRKLLLQTRPYELNPGQTDRVHAECLELLGNTIETQGETLPVKFEKLQTVMKTVKQKFNSIEANYHRKKPLLGIVGEIYCRLDDFTNDNLIRIIEKYGGEAWLSSISEWVFYTNFMQKTDLAIQGMRFSKSMLGNVVRNRVQRQDEHLLTVFLHDHFYGYEEPHSIKEIVENAQPYFSHREALGEMLLNVGGSVFYYQKGADGIVDISPFTCMNGIVCEAIYPRVSRDNNRIPIRNFYFDGTESELDRDVEIFLELADSYRRRKKVARKYPSRFVLNNS